MEDNNINGKIAKDRDVWLNMEEHILGENPEYQKKVAEYNKRNAHVLYAEAIELIKEIESGKLEDEQIKKNVEEITILFAALTDSQRENVRERFRDRLKINPDQNQIKQKRIREIMKLLEEGVRGKTKTYPKGNENER